MGRALTAAALLAALLPALPSTESAAGGGGGRDPCVEPRVQYTPFGTFQPNLSDRIVLVALDPDASRKVLAGAGEKTFSVHRTRWFSVERPEHSKPAPWTTTLIVYRDRDEVLTLSLVDHGSGDVTATWINEKLLFVKVWWGRIVATELILDVETKGIVYREMSDYGEFIVSCPDSGRREPLRR